MKLTDKLNSMVEGKTPKQLKRQFLALVKLIKQEEDLEKEIERNTDKRRTASLQKRLEKNRDKQESNSEKLVKEMGGPEGGYPIDRSDEIQDLLQLSDEEAGYSGILSDGPWS